MSEKLTQIWFEENWFRLIHDSLKQDDVKNSVYLVSLLKNYDRKKLLAKYHRRPNTYSFRRIHSQMMQNIENHISYPLAKLLILALQKNNYEFVNALKKYDDGNTVRFIFASMVHFREILRTKKIYSQHLDFLIESCNVKIRIEHLIEAIKAKNSDIAILLMNDMSHNILSKNIDIILNMSVQSENQCFFFKQKKVCNSKDPEISKIRTHLYQYKPHNCEMDVTTHSGDRTGIIDICQSLMSEQYSPYEEQFKKSK